MYMGKRRVKKSVKQAATSKNDAVKGTQIDDKNLSLLDQEVERQSAAIRAIRDVEIEHSMTGLRLLRSYFSEEQLKAPALKFFEENLPNVSIVRNGEDGRFEVHWNDEDGNLRKDHVDGRDIRASLLRRMSLAYPDCSGIPSFGGFDFSTQAVKTRLLGADNLQIRDFVLEGPADSQMLGMQDAFQTPGVSSQRLSIGMTPKTLRLPKHGEMLLSVRGSPLGVYKEDNMEAIHESEEG